MGGALLITPSGVLDGEEAGRLRRVLVGSRETSYECVVLDLRELVGIGTGGVDLMRELRDREQKITFVAGPVAQHALRAAGLAVEDDLERVLAPHRDDAPR